MLLSKEKESQVEFNPGLSANRPSNNWAQLSEKKAKFIKIHETVGTVSELSETRKEPLQTLKEVITSPMQMDKRMDKLEVDWNNDCNCGFSKSW